MIHGKLDEIVRLIEQVSLPMIKKYNTHLTLGIY